MSNSVQIQPTQDVAYIDSVISELWPLISCDQHPPFGSALPAVQDPHNLFIEVVVDGARAGLVALIGSEVHTLFLPVLRGSRAVKVGRAIRDWIWANTSRTELTSYAYSHRPEVAMFARLCGFNPTKVVDDHSTINGVPVLRTDFICLRP